jgi:hypothetical protein
MSWFKQILRRSAEHNVLERAATELEKEAPGPTDLSRREVKQGEEQRYCTYWQRPVVLVPGPLFERTYLSCEWSLKDNPNKRLCIRPCVHNVVNQIIIVGMSKEKQLSEAEVMTLSTYLGVKDHAPKS